MEFDEIKGSFPQLVDDNKAKITSGPTYDYNCIAWALVYDDRIVWPHEKNLDGVSWPKHLPRNSSIENFIELFKYYGHEICDSTELEKNYRKVALYVDSEMNCTHAARQKIDGLWTSKLGPQNDIAHSSPISLEGEDYGKVYCIMKKFVG